MSDQLFKKRKVREQTDLRRKQTAQTKKTILILCEGKNPECRYLKRLAEELHIESRVTVQHGKDKALISLGKKAIKEQEESEYGKVYLVIDDDGRSNEIEKLKNELQRHQQIILIISDPCFEFWLLLHFTKTTRPFKHTEGGKSACKQVTQELKKKRRLPKYEKNAPKIFETTYSDIETALKTAKSLSGHPSTNIHILVEDLRELAREL